MRSRPLPARDERRARAVWAEDVVAEVRGEGLRDEWGVGGAFDFREGELCG